MDAMDDAMDADDRALLARIARGEQAALQELYARYRPRLWRYLAQQLARGHGDTGLVEEVLQDVFVAVWRQAGGFRGEARVVTWLFHIARHRALNARRDASRRIEDAASRHASEGGTAEEAAWQQPSCEDEVLERMTLADALTRLSPKHREVLQLVFYHGVALAEVAQILDVPVGTVKSRLSYARRALAGQLAPELSQEGSPHDA